MEPCKTVYVFPFSCWAYELINRINSNVSILIKRGLSLPKLYPLNIFAVFTLDSP
jgi:hypothetical protein